MQRLDNTIIPDSEELDDAELVIETMLLGMKTITSQIRHSKPRDLSVPQFRMLAFLSHEDGASLSRLAEHLGLTASSVCRTVDNLVVQGLVERERQRDDRRMVCLSLSSEGERLFEELKETVRAGVAEILRTLPLDQRLPMLNSMTALQAVLSRHWQEQIPEGRSET